MGILVCAVGEEAHPPCPGDISGISSSQHQYGAATRAVSRRPIFQSEDRAVRHSFQATATALLHVMLVTSVQIF